jgi:acetylornithine/N-succinyldiaminopimelate aminotransferase
MRLATLDSPASLALMDVTARPPVVFSRGEGSWIWDTRGRRYLDMVQGWAVNIFGHSPAVVREALARQAALLLTPGPGFFNEASIRLAEALVRHSPFDRAFFANSGAEANEGAIKLARKWGQVARGGAFEIITFDHAFHGRTLATMSASGKPRFRELFEPKVPGFPKARLNDLASVEALVTERTAAVMLEPIQGEAGVLPAHDTFLQELRALATRAGILLIVDEVQTGMGRTGRLWAHDHAGIQPDIMTLGKMLGGGVPLAALLATEAVSCFAHGDQGGTLNGNPLMTAVGLAVLEALLAPGVLSTVAARGEWLRSRLTALAGRHALGEVRGRGLLLALDLGRPSADRVADAARAEGLLVNAPQPSVLRFVPALNVSQDELESMLQILDRVLEAVASETTATDKFSAAAPR